MLTYKPTPDLKWKLNLSSFITLPHLLDCLNFYQEFCVHCIPTMMMPGWDRWGWLIYRSLWVGGQQVGIIS